MNNSKGQISNEFVGGGLDMGLIEPAAGIAGPLNTVIELRNENIVPLRILVTKFDIVFNLLFVGVHCVQMDLAKAYYQLRTTNEERSNTEFVTPRG